MLEVKGKIKNATLKIQRRNIDVDILWWEKNIKSAIRCNLPHRSPSNTCTHPSVLLMFPVLPFTLVPDLWLHLSKHTPSTSCCSEPWSSTSEQTFSWWAALSAGERWNCRGLCKYSSVMAIKPAGHFTSTQNDRQNKLRHSFKRLC